MRSSRVGFAAFAATVSLCVFLGGVTGAVISDGLLARGAQAAEQGVKPGGFGSGTGLGGGAIGRTGTGPSGQAGSGGASGSEALEPGAGTAAGASSNDRAVDRTIGIGRPQGNGLGAGAAGGSAKDQEAGSGKAGTTALGKPADKQGEDGQSGTAAKTKDGDSALEPEAMSTMAAAAPAVGGRPNNAPEKPSVPEITGNGFFTQKIGIDVPGFRGLEPKLSLAYNSARKTRLGGLYQGWLGYAWGIDGFDVIERATPGYGYPYFDANDVYLLNGEELVRCTTGMVAASCSAGGTHVTENENFKRVTFDATANTWTVTDRDGTVSLFKSVMAISGSTPASGTPDYQVQHDGRFLLSSVTDTNGNVVNYGYTCPDLPVCYPSVVSYGGMSVNFYYEARPDYLVMANGLGLSYTKQRIRTIAVRVGAALRTAYALTYDQAPFSNTSRLTKVDRYGRDATVTAAGAVTGPTSKTIRQMTYDNLVISYQQGYYAQPQRECCASYISARETAVDFDSDGKDELEVITNVEGRDSAPSHTILWDVYRFNSGGAGAHIASVDLRPLYLKDPSLNSKVYPLVAGRFSAGASKEVPVSYIYATPNGWDEYASDKAVIWLGGLSDCYGAVCSQFYQEPNPYSEPPSVAALDHDGDGVDILVGGGVTGIGDFAANGRQGFININNGATASRFINGAWVTTWVGANCDKGTGYLCILGDLNGDGTTDLIAGSRSSDHGNYQVGILLSTGTRFVQVWASEWEGWSLRDADNDGRVDIYINGTVYALGFAPAGPQLLPSNYALPSNFTVSGDFNGDGLPDLIRPGSDNPMFSQFGAGNPNLLRSVKLETGGVVSVDYTPSTRWTNVFMPQVLHAVTQLRVDDGRGQVAATDYAYAGGLYDPKARKFLGYKTITMTKPLANGETARPVVETTYRQDLASYGLPEKTVIRNGANTASKTVTETYAVNAATKPYTSLNTATETTVNEQYTVTTRKERIFDAYGNITHIRDLGRTDVSGDESMTEFYYTPPNTSKYLVSAAHTRRVMNMTTGEYLAWDIYHYDNIWDYNTTPAEKGNVTWFEQVRKDGRSDNVWTVNLTTYAYDVYGNRTVQIDPMGSRTEWDYDATYHLYPVTERAPKYFATGGQPADARFVSTFSNDVVCGKPATKLDWNGVTETFTYDPFCRPYDYTHSGTGKYVKTRYANEGNPAQQSVAVFEPWSSGTGDVYTQTYYDGIGRPWRVQSLGDTTSGPTRVTDTVYDPRGNAARTSFAYFANETAQWTVNSYDWQDRVVKTVNPDASQKIYSYAARPTSAAVMWGSASIAAFDAWLTDELGQQYNTVTDVHGYELGRFNHKNGVFTAYHISTYDALGRLLGVQDTEGARWTYTYDLAGNRVSASDPDLGYWTYMYDGANRLIRQIDARGSLTTLFYDQMGRLLAKQVRGAGEASPTTVAANAYDQLFSTGSSNVGLLTQRTNANSTDTYTRTYFGAGTYNGETHVVDGLTYWRSDTLGRQGKTAGIIYGAPVVTVGTADPYWVYNSADLLYSIPDYITSTFYEADGQTKSIAYANGVTTEFAYSPTRRWLTRVTTKKGTTVLMDNQYTRNAIGQIKTITGLTPSDSWVYTYTTDGFNRLASADNLGNNALDETYSYSLNGNLTSRTRMGSYTYPAGNAVRPHAATQIGTKTIGYDANGNMVSDGTRTLVWDRSNQLASVTQGGSAVTFSYGADGSRVMKNWAFGKTLYAGADIEIDRTTPGAEVYTYYPHPDIKVVATAAGAISKFFLHRDHLASVRLVTDVAGTVAEQTSYAAYGETTNPTMQTKKGYIGERFDVETGLMYLNARYYDPAFGRFIEKDEQADIGEEADQQVDTILRSMQAAIGRPGTSASTSGMAPAASHR